MRKAIFTYVTKFFTITDSTPRWCPESTSPLVEYKGDLFHFHILTLFNDYVAPKAWEEEPFAIANGKRWVEKRVRGIDGIWESYAMLSQLQ